MKILALVSDSFGAGGGIAQYNRDLFGALAATPAVTSIDVLPRHAPEVAGALPGKVRQMGAPAGRAAYVPAAFAQARRLRPGVVFCGHLNLVPLAAAVASRAKARLVVQLHGVEAWERPPALHRRAVEKADLVLCVSRHTRQRLLTWADIMPERVAVLPNTVSDAFSPGDKSAARRKLGLAERPTLLSVGRLDARERYKGHDRVIRLLSALRDQVGDVVYLIAGDGDDMSRLQSLAADCGVSPRVSFLGQIPAPQLPDLYRAADLFVLPSTGEGFGIVYLEAMASGTPALGLAEKGALDALAHGELGSAVSEDQLLNAMAQSLKLPARSGPHLADAVRTRFGRDVFARQASAVFSQALDA